MAALALVLPLALATPRVTSVGLVARLRLATTERVVVRQLLCSLAHLVVLPRILAARSSPAVGVTALSVGLAVVCARLVGARLGHPRAAAAGVRQ